MTITPFVSNLRRFFAATKSWKKPRRAKLLMYNVFGADIVLSLVDKRHAEVLDIEQISMPIFLGCMMRLKFHTQDYVRAYIEHVEPKVLITCMDTGPQFWALKESFPDITTIIVQYSLRTEVGDIFGFLKKRPPRGKFKVDYILTHGAIIGRKYLEYIQGQVVPIGSYKNNHFRKAAAAAPNTLTFISAYRPKQPCDPVFFFVEGEPYYRDVFYEAEAVLLPLLARYCKRHGIQLRVCGHGYTPGEYEFFADMIGHTEWDFIARYRPAGSYDAIDRSMLVVTVDSTLGYEALGRGSRTAFFSGRWSSLASDSLRFGWPGGFAECGPFWASHVNEGEVDRILDFLRTVGDSQWEETRVQYAADLMVFDPGNKRLLQILTQLGVPPAERPTG